MNKPTIASQVLEFIRAAGDNGRRFSDIQRKYCRIAGLSWSRGQACSNLVAFHDGYFSQTFPGHFGLLYSWCKKNDAGKWVLAEEPVVPLYRGYMNVTRTYNEWCVKKGVPPIDPKHYTNC